MKEKLSRLLSKPWAAYTTATCSAVLLYLFLTHLGSVKTVLEAIYGFLSPVIIGIIVAYIFNPVEDFFENRLLGRRNKDKSRHGLAVILTIIAIVLVLALFLVVLIPSLVNSVSKLIENKDAYMLKLEELLIKAEALTAKYGINFDLETVRGYLDNATTTVMDYLKNNYQSILSAAGSIGTSVSNFAVGVLFGFCFLFAERFLTGLVNRIRAAFLSPDTIERHDELFSRCNGIFVRYLSCTLLDSLIIGVCTLIFTLIVGINYGPLIAFICAFTNIIPTIGPWIGTAIGIFFIVLDKPINVLWFVIFCCVLQSIDGMLIKPKLFKNGLGIPAVWSFILLILGGKIAGMAGIILSIPVGAVIEIVYEESIVPWLDKQAAKRVEASTDEDTDTNEA